MAKLIPNRYTCIYYNVYRTSRIKPWVQPTQTHIEKNPIPPLATQFSIKPNKLAK